MFSILVCLHRKFVFCLLLPENKISAKPVPIKGESLLSFVKIVAREVNRIYLKISRALLKIKIIANTFGNGAFSIEH